MENMSMVGRGLWRRSSIVVAVFVAIGGVIGSGCAMAADEVIVAGRAKMISGEVVSTTAQQVIVKDSNASEPITLRVGEITEIRWNREPSALKSIRTQLRNGEVATAFATINRFSMQGNERKEIREEIDFLKAHSAARTALETGELTTVSPETKESVTLSGTSAVTEAGQLVNGFLRQYPNSWRTYAATMELAELLASAGRYPVALTAYQKAAELASTSTDKIRSTFQLARIQAICGQDAEAVKRFDAILKLSDTKDPAVRAMQLQSQLGRARLAVATDPAAALKTADELLVEASKEDSGIPESERPSVFAQCWLIRGLVLEAQNQPQDAIFAFLRVDTMYSSDRFAHAEALSHLMGLLEKAKRLDRAAKMRRTLLARYSDTPWAPK